MQYSIEQTKRNFIVICIVVVLGGVSVFVVNYFFGGDGDVLVDPVSISVDISKEEGVPSGVDPYPDDMDRDGLVDTKEVELGLSAVLPDSDSDGIDDKMEIEQYKSDPLKFDTDDDGYGDGWEVLKGYSPTGPGTLVVSQE